MKKLLKCMVMAVASIGLAFTGCKIDDGGSTPVFWPIGGSGSSSVVAAEVSISGVTNESVIYTAGETANAFKVSYSIISKDSTHLEGDVSVEWFNENGEKVGDDASYTPVVPATVEGVKIYRYKVVVTNSCPDATGADKIKKAEKDVIIIVKPADMPEDSIYAAPILIDVTGKKEYVAGETASKLTVSSVVTEKKNAKRGTVTYKWYTREDGPVVATGVEYTPDISKYSSISSATAVSIWVEAINDCSATATIEPKIQSSGKKEVKITVKPQATTPVSVVISNKTDNSITTGNSKKYSVTVTLSDGTKVYNATWKSDNSSIVSVDNNGNVTALKAGTATIKATYTAGGVEKNDSVSITVTDAPVGNGNAGISIDFN